MAPYSYNQFYDPVGGQSNQPTGYTYSGQQSTASTQYPSQPNYQTSYSRDYSNAYNNQQYGTTGQQQQHSTSGSNRALSYDNNSYYASAGFATALDRSEVNDSPLYATGTASTFGSLSLADQSQSSPNTFANTQNCQPSSTAASSRTYRNEPSSAQSRSTSSQTAYGESQSQQQPQQPPRYASPLHAVQAQQQHGHSKQPPRISNHGPSSQMAARNLHHHQQQQQQSYRHRQQRTSIEPSPTTVDPSQVYDMRAEQQRKAQIEAEKREKVEMQRRAAEEARAAEAARKAAEARIAEEQRAEREARETEEKAKKAEDEIAKKKVAQEKRTEQRRQAREEKRQSKTAATALTQMASSSGTLAARNVDNDLEMAGMPGVGDMAEPPANDEEAEMRAMFRKMREFNARNPDMLSRLWEEERKAHAAQSPSQPAKQAQAPAPASNAPQQPAATTTPAPKSNRAPQRAAAVATAAPKADATQATPTVPRENTVLWPVNKKGSVAEVAADYVNDYPDNRHAFRVMSAEDILKILDTNPSYVELCERIERTGMRMDRSALAKALLQVAKNNNAKRGEPLTTVSEAAAQGNGPANSNDKRKPGRAKKDGPTSYHVPPAYRRANDAGLVAYQALGFQSLSDTARPENNVPTMPTFAQAGPSTIASAISIGAGNTPIQSPHIEQPASNGNSRPQSKAQHVVESKAEPVGPEAAPRPPTNKEEAARKRTFNDLVDLTRDDSDDEGPPRKIQQPFSGPPNGAVKHNAPPSGFHSPMSYQQLLQQTATRVGMSPGHGTLQPSAPARPPWGAFSNQPPGQSATSVVPSQPPAKPKGPTEEQKQNERMRGKMLVEPIVRDRVARRSKYDSRTIARDVLLATGRHPDMRALNSHLNRMQKLLGDHGGAVDGAGNKSDLATIRWDIIDPGESVVDEAAKTRPVSNSRDEELAKIAASAQDGAPDEADDKGAALEPVSKPPRPHEVLSGEELMLKMREVATDEEWARIGEERMQKRLKKRYQQRRFRERRMAKSHHGKPSPPRPSIEGTEQRSRPPEADDVGDQPQAQAAFERGGTNPIKRRGRPPKSKNTGPDRVALVSAEPSIHPPDNDNLLQSDVRPAVHTPAKTTFKPKAAAASPAMSSGGAVGYAAFRQYDENGNLVKKKGRPVGWRKSVHSREAQGLQPIKSGGHVGGSKLRKSTAGSAGKIVQPQYQVYKCQWSHCTAELDNLDRLKKHVVKLHGAPNSDAQFECRWQPCRFAGTRVDADGKAYASEDDAMTFESIEPWLNHVSKEHIDPVAWKLGDGPRGGSVADQHTDSESYLSDAHGRSVTPVIVPLQEQQRQQQQDPPILTSNVKRVGRPPAKPASESKEVRAAKAELEKLAEQKRIEGFILGQEGSVLATDWRRRGFLDDEDFMDFVPAEETEF